MRLLLIPLLWGCQLDKFEPNADTGGVTLADQDGDGYADDDCDDSSSTVHPGAGEICDGIDNNCDGAIDEGVSSTYYADTDDDGFGDSAVSMEGCDQADGFVPTGNDCVDTDPTIFPGAGEVCDEIDNDCDGTIDEGVQSTFYADSDGDGYGDPATGAAACQAPDGHTADNTDCDDALSTVSPDGIEVCDELDNNCDGTVDEDVTTTFYADSDGDGYGLSDDTVEACTLPAGFSTIDGDCDDTAAAVSPDGVEVCDGVDNNCDDTADEPEAIDASTFYADDDGDGFGDASDPTDACTQPSGHVSDATDCDDTAAAVNPDAAEVCNETDDDCDGSTDEGVTTTFYEDDDGDGYGDALDDTEACSAPAGYVSNSTDCDDRDSAINPGASEVCDSEDNDCDGDTDDADSSLDASTGETFYADGDLDGYGDDADTLAACEAPSGYTDAGSDCDDTDADINPAETDDCNGLDDDCSGYADDGGDCPCGVEYSGDSVYMFCTDTQSWADAQAACADYDYHLLTIDDATENSWADTTADTYSTERWWMGFNDIDSEGTWVWDGGSASTYTNWNTGQPSNDEGDEDCGQINRSSLLTSWNDSNCSNTYNYVCEAD